MAIQLDLVIEILRYASIDCGSDPLLTLERECAALVRPTIVVIDGPKSLLVNDVGWVPPK